LRVLNNAFGYSLEFEEKAAMPLAGGIMQHGYQCGMIWGAALAAGAQAYRRFGPGQQAETRTIVAAQRLVESYRRLNNDINCLEITGLDKSSSTMQMINYFLIKGGTVRCFRTAVTYAQAAFTKINAVFSEDPIQAPFFPVSCAAMLAQKMGASDMHTVMSAGLAGGIGLCGGACGALGAAIWIISVNNLKEGDRKIDFKSPIAMNAINRFLKSTDFECECFKIVGRRFENVDDHAAYLRNGGCSTLIDILAAK
jgi:hypothetical protein